MADKSLDNYLKSAQELVRIAPQAERLARLQRAYAEIAPAYLVRGSLVANVKAGKLVIHAANGAFAAKLKQLSPRLAEEFRRRGFQVTEVEVRVQVTASNDIRLTAPPRAPLSEETKRRLMDLAGVLPEDSPVRCALIRLVDRSG